MCESALTIDALPMCRGPFATFYVKTEPALHVYTTCNGCEIIFKRLGALMT